MDAFWGYVYWRSTRSWPPLTWHPSSHRTTGSGQILDDRRGQHKACRHALPPCAPGLWPRTRSCGQGCCHLSSLILQSLGPCLLIPLFRLSLLRVVLPPANSIGGRCGRVCHGNLDSHRHGNQHAWGQTPSKQRLSVTSTLWPSQRLLTSFFHCHRSRYSCPQACSA